MKTIEPDTHAKILSDHWIHQNGLMWGRLHTVIISQIGLLGAAYTLSSLGWKGLAFGGCVLAAIASVALIQISHHDRRVRDKYRVELKQFGVHLSIDFNDPAQAAKHQDSPLSIKFFDAKSYMKVVLFIFGLLDVFAAVVFLGK